MRIRFKESIPNLFCIALCSCWTLTGFSQSAPLQVDAGEDTSICAAGDSVQLLATPSKDNILSVRWEPAAAAATPDALATRVSVSAVTPFTVSVLGFDGENLIENGDFSQGDTGFRSDYRQGQRLPFVDPLANANRYGIDDDPRDQHRNFPACGDHSSGNGNMMLVNGSGEPNAVWCQEVAVEPNTKYAFEGWITAMSGHNPAVMEVYINGELTIGRFNPPQEQCTWYQFTTFWESGNAGSADICLVDANPSDSGNDFALDDFFFAPVVEVTDEVIVTPVSLNPEVAVPATLCQEEPAIALDSWLLPETTPGGSWQVDGQAAASITPGELATGTHTVSYQITQEGCNAESSYDLEIVAAPSSGTALDNPTFCSSVDTIIELNRLLEGADPGGLWIETSASPSLPGSFDNEKGVIDLSGQSSGVYAFRYAFDTGGACPNAGTTIEITLAQTPPADAGPDQALDCIVPTVTIGRPVNDPGADLTQQWYDSNDQPLGNGTEPVLTTDQTGVYRLEVTDNQSGCSNSDEVTVTSNITQPIAAVSVIPVSCYDDADGAIRVDSVADGSGPFLYSLNGGGLSSQQQFSNLAPGAYTLTVEDANGCTEEKEVIIEYPIELTAAISSNYPGETPLVPLGDSIRLEALTNISTDQIDSVRWEPALPDCDNCLSGIVQPMKSNTYRVTITDVNGCRASGEINIRLQRQEQVFIPNAFSPDNDGVNDVLMIYAGPSVANVRYFRVFNRWGSLIYDVQNIHPNDPGFGWDGFYQGRKLDSGVYIFAAELELIDGSAVTVSGDVTMIN